MEPELDDYRSQRGDLLIYIYVWDIFNITYLQCVPWFAPRTIVNRISTAHPYKHMWCASDVSVCGVMLIIGFEYDNFRAKDDSHIWLMSTREMGEDSVWYGHSQNIGGPLCFGPDIWCNLSSQKKQRNNNIYMCTTTYMHDIGMYRCKFAVCAKEGKYISKICMCRAKRYVLLTNIPLVHTMGNNWIVTDYGKWD